MVAYGKQWRIRVRNEVVTLRHELVLTPDGVTASEVEVTRKEVA